MIAETHRRLADALNRQQRTANILCHHVGEIQRAPACRQPQRDAGVARTQLQRADKAQIENRFVQLRVEHLREPIHNSRAIVPSRELTSHIVAHGSTQPRQTLFFAQDDRRMFWFM